MNEEEMKDVFKAFDMDTSKFDPQGERTKQALDNAYHAIKDPHVQNLIALTLKIDSMSDAELQEIGRQMRSADPN